MLGRGEPEITELGVVDPLRPPAPVLTLIRRLRRLPTIAWFFIVLAIVQMALETADITDAGVSWPDLLAPSALVAALSTASIVLLPAAIVGASRHALSDTPRLFSGAAALAIGTLGATFAWRLFSFPLGDFGDLFSPMTTWDGVLMSFRALMIALTVGGLLILALGVRDQRVGRPSTRLRLAALVVGSAIALNGVGTFASIAASTGRIADLSPDNWYFWQLVVAGLGSAEPIAFGFLAYAITLGTGIRGWGRLAVSAASAAVGCLLINSLVFSLIELASLSPVDARESIGQALLGFLVPAEQLRLAGNVLLVVAFAAGFGRPALAAHAELGEAAG
jgi:hypothetical protein